MSKYSTGITEEIIEQFILDMIPKPTKEKPILFWVGAQCFKNDGEHLFALCDFEKDSWRQITRREFDQLTTK